MRPMLFRLAVCAAIVVPHAARAGGYNRVYLVPAVKRCTTAATCPREFASSFTFDAIVLRSPATKYLPAGKPSLILDVHGVRDASGAPLNGTLMLRVLSGRVSLAGLGTFPDDSSLTQQAPIPVTVEEGGGKPPLEAAAGGPAGPHGHGRGGGGQRPRRHPPGGAGISVEPMTAAGECAPP